MLPIVQDAHGPPREALASDDLIAERAPAPARGHALRWCPARAAPPQPLLGRSLHLLDKVEQVIGLHAPHVLGSFLALEATPSFLSGSSCSSSCPDLNALRDPAANPLRSAAI